MSGGTVKVTSSSFKEDVLDSKNPVLVDFWAEWCGPCRQVGPILETLAKEHEGSLTVAKVNVDEEPQLAALYGVSSIPTMVLFKDGEVVKGLVGAAPKHTLEKEFNLA